jgi:hypothetical protein
MCCNVNVKHFKHILSTAYFLRYSCNGKWNCPLPRNRQVPHGTCALTSCKDLTLPEISTCAVIAPVVTRTYHPEHFQSD